MQEDGKGGDSNDVAITNSARLGKVTAPIYGVCHKVHQVSCFHEGCIASCSAFEWTDYGLEGWRGWGRGYFIVASLSLQTNYSASLRDTNDNESLSRWTRRGGNVGTMSDVGYRRMPPASTTRVDGVQRTYFRAFGR